ncbi:MAG: hypothetical protein ACM3WS_07800 [Bacillota bacterium]
MPVLGKGVALLRNAPRRSLHSILIHFVFWLICHDGRLSFRAWHSWDVPDLRRGACCLFGRAAATGRARHATNPLAGATRPAALFL